ncbi:MAG: 2-amino-4-hydroxy-6-hydroxymethyldihydropteridine diphosphokinase [Gammaproteobacteria bacterium]
MSHAAPSSSVARWVYLGLGSNLGDSRATLESAVAELRETRGLDEVRVSAVYRTAPLGPQDQPHYLNAVVSCTTSLAPEVLLDLLQEIESAHGRQRESERRWGPRTLDLDILLMEGVECVTDRLTLPHPGLMEREFVLIPLAEIAPDLTLPGGERVAALAERIPRRSMQRCD